MSTAERRDRALAFLAGLVTADGTPWGQRAIARQWADAEAILDESGARRTWAGRPRGGSKTEDVAAIVLAAMTVQAPVGAQLYAAASDRDQANLMMSAMRGWIRRNPALESLFRVVGDRVHYDDKAVTFTVLPADAAGSWGLNPWLLVTDELCQWPATRNAREFYEALVTALPKVAGSRQVVITTAGSPLHWSYPIWQESGRSPRWRRLNWTAADGLAPTPWQDPDELEEQRQSLPEASWRRLYLNEWSSVDEALFDEASLAAVLRPTDEPVPYRHEDGSRYVISLDLGLTSDRTALAVSHVEWPAAFRPGPGEAEPTEASGALVVVDRLVYWEGSKGRPVDLPTVQREVERQSRAYGHAPVVFDPYQAIQLGQSLRAQGVRAEPFAFSAASRQKLAATAIRLRNESAWRLPRDSRLVEELRGLRVVERTAGGQYSVDHPSGGHDDGFVACVLGAHHLLQAPTLRVGSAGLYSDQRLSASGRSRGAPAPREVAERPGEREAVVEWLRRDRRPRAGSRR